MSQFSRRLGLAFEILLVAALILTTRCSNFRDVFVGANIYFTDGDCYARMTRVRLCAQHPGVIIRHHTFENFPDGTTPHTTAPFDYLILLFSYLLGPFTFRPIDMAGAFISPALAVAAGVFLCWWSYRLRIPFRWATLILFIVSPILVHGTALGRPDHQSLLILLVTVALCADWAMYRRPARGWSITRAAAWALALWVSLYEPLLLMIVSHLTTLLMAWFAPPAGDHVKYSLTGTLRRHLDDPERRLGWLVFAAIILADLLIERRLPGLSIFVSDPLFRNWSGTVGELNSVPLFSSIWFTWLGWLAVLTPMLLVPGWWRKDKERKLPLSLVVALCACFCLTMAQARWGYFLALTFALSLPTLLGVLRWRPLAWIVFTMSLWPVLADWDRQLWPDDRLAGQQLERRHEAVELREVSAALMSGERQPFLAPWWLSPAIAYWSGQPGVAGSSHESLAGIADSARFFLASDPTVASGILRKHQVRWVVVYDAQRVVTNAAALLGDPVRKDCLASVLDQRSSRAPTFLRLSAQNGTAKIFEVTNKW